MTQSISTQSFQLIALDIDGTLLNSQHEMTERVEKTLKTAMEQGIQVVVATGKTLISGKYVIERLGLTTPGVYLQGTAIYNSDGSLRHQQTLEPRIARQVITFAEDRDYNVAIYSGTRILVRALNQRIEELTTHYHEPLPEAVGSLHNMVDSVPINKLLIVSPGEPRRITALRWQLSMQINGSARLLQAGIADMLEILPPGASKGAGLKSLLKDLGIPSSAVMAMGDAENDIEMLQLVGLGVAIGNAGQHLKDVADEVVASNDEDGVAEAVERFVLKTPEVAAESQPASE